MLDDPEISAMGAIKQALEALDESARERVLRWARDRYGVLKGVATREPAPSWSGAAPRTDILPREQNRASFTDVAGLYDAANPTSDADKMLAIGYWFQVVRGETELDSQSLNTELKNLGYPIGNITRAVSSLGQTVPKFVIQTKKSGTTKQARKKFRLTVEGIRRVEQMMGGIAAAPLRPSADDASSDDTDE